MKNTLRIGASVASLLTLALWAGSASTETTIERGRYLVDGLVACGNCHTPRNPDNTFAEGMYMAGGFEFNEMPAFHAYARNITPDTETGIGDWTLEEIVLAVREGHTPEDETVGPPMPIFFYNFMSDDDAMSIAMYLKSIPAVRNEVPEAVYNIPKATPGPAPGGPTPPATDQVAYGQYLATMAHCFDCHTPRDATGGPDMAQMGAGGFQIQALPNGDFVRSANITPAAIGDWSDEALRRAIIDGLSNNGHILFPIMPSSFFKNATTEDIDAIIAYLRTIPSIENEVPKVDWMAALGMPAMQNAPAME
jgi:mono/diheme cytochrome c family protein